MALRRKRNDKPPKEAELSQPLQDRIFRGRQHLNVLAPYRDLSYEFYRGNHYAYVDEQNLLQTQATLTSVRGQGKPRWRARQKVNLIMDAVLRLAALSTQRVPGYGVVPSTSDPDDISAAHLAEKVAMFGHDRWRIRRAAYDAVLHAVIGGEAFAWPYFDTSIGPFITGEGIGEGDVRIGLFSANECYWEPGLRFHQSPWHVVEQARTVETVEQMPNFLGGTLTADADSRQLSHSARGRDASDKRGLILVSEYLERPTPNNPQGRWIVMANNRRVVPDRPYPGDGQEPILRKLSYAPDPDNDRDPSLVAQALDAQRTRNDTRNKQVEWKNLALMPQWAAAPGAMRKQTRTDEPGKVYEIPQPDQNLQVLDPPAVPRELFEMEDRATADIGRLFASQDIPSQVESGKAVEALLESDKSRNAAFIVELAEWYSQIMHDSLVLVQNHYTEPRLIQVKGDFGWESIDAFRGSQLRNQVDVKVYPDSIQPQTKTEIEQRVMNYAQLGWVGSEDAMTAIETGTTERVLRSLAQDEARVGRIIQRIKEGPDSLFNMPMLPTGRMIPSPDGQVSGQPEMVPGWMPRYSDNLQVFRVTFEDWMKTEEFERLDPQMQVAAAQIYAGVLELEAQKMQEKANAQAQMAEGMGMENAARPQGAKPLPSMASAGGDQNKQETS